MALPWALILETFACCALRSARPAALIAFMASPRDLIWETLASLAARLALPALRMAESVFWWAFSAESRAAAAPDAPGELTFAVALTMLVDFSVLLLAPTAPERLEPAAAVELALLADTSSRLADAFWQLPLALAAIERFNRVAASELVPAADAFSRVPPALPRAERFEPTIAVKLTLSSASSTSSPRTPAFDKSTEAATIAAFALYMDSLNSPSPVPAADENRNAASCSAADSFETALPEL